MNANDQPQPGGPRRALLGWIFSAAVILATAPVLVFYAGRLVDPLPLYAFDEGTYLARALHGAALAADPTLDPGVGSVTNSAYFAVLRAVAGLAGPGLPWIRAASLAAYLGGIGLTWACVRRGLSAGAAWSVLLLALLFPNWRFVLSALPEGWYVGGLGLVVFATDRLYARRPVVHALLAGVLAAVLTLIKPQGLAMAAALAALPLIEAMLGEQRIGLAAARLGVLLPTYFGAGWLIQTLAHQPMPGPLVFFEAPLYSGLLAGRPARDAIGLTLTTLAGLASLMAVLAGVPILAGLGARFSRWRARASPPTEGPERAFLLVLLSLVATLAMVAAFTFRASAYESEQGRLLGRYVEFFAPLLWLTAAPFVGLARGWRRPVAACAVVLAGLAGLLAVFRAGVVLFPWDSAALTAFFRSDPRRFALAAPLPYRALAVAATFAVGLAMLARAPMARAWQAYVLALALLSTAADRLWVDAAGPGRRDLAHDLSRAQAILAARQGPVLAITDDPNIDRIVFLRFAGHPHMLLAAPGEHVLGWQAAPYATVLAQGDHPIVGAAWRPLYRGRQISVFAAPGT